VLPLFVSSSTSVEKNLHRNFQPLQQQSAIIAKDTNFYTRSLEQVSYADRAVRLQWHDYDCLNEVSISDDMKNSKMIIFTVFGRLPYFCATSHRNHSVDYDRDLARSLN
jgi:hypothetical protein